MTVFRYGAGGGPCRILWAERVLNDDVLRKAGVKSILTGSIVERRSNIVDHLLCHSNWFTTLIEGMIEGRSRKGRFRQDA